MEKAGFLRATQNELIGAKVAAIAKALQTIDPKKLDPLVVSRDNYIVDGHHRWAAEVAISAEAGNFDRPLEIYRVNSDILPLLKLADDFTGGKGHEAGSLKPGESALNLKTENHFLDGETHAHDSYDPEQPRVGAGEKGGGEWTSSGGGSAAPSGKKDAPPSASPAKVPNLGTSPIISSRNVTAKRAQGDDSYKRVDTDAMKGDPALYKHNVGLFKLASFYRQSRSARRVIRTDAPEGKRSGPTPRRHCL